MDISEKEKKLDKLQYEIPLGNSGFFLIRKSWTPPSGVCSFWAGRAGRARGVLDISADNDQKTWQTHKNIMFPFAPMCFPHVHMLNLAIVTRLLMSTGVSKNVRISKSRKIALGIRALVASIASEQLLRSLNVP